MTRMIYSEAYDQMIPRRVLYKNMFWTWSEEDRAYKCEEIWEDYTYIDLDFALRNAIC